MNRPAVVRPGDPAWPERFGHLHSPPKQIWWRGASLPSHPAVAVVGSRRASAVGLEVAHRIGATLAEAGVDVVSGMALGIDGEAHRGALDAGGRTHAVLGCGIDRCYPPRHAGLRDRILERGSVLSEQPPGMAPRRQNFPARNRLIAALVVAVVVVEAAELSGALSTAAHATELGREILAVPGPILSTQSEGTNRLIRDGAQPVLSPDDVVAAVAGLGGVGGVGEAGPPRSAPPRLPAELRRIDTLLAGGPVGADRLAELTALDPAELARRLTELELRGRVRTGRDGLLERAFARGRRG